MKKMQSKLLTKPSFPKEKDENNWQSGQKINSIFDIFGEGNN